MSIISVTKQSSNIKYSVLRFTESVWLDDKGDAGVRVELIINVDQNSAPIHALEVLISGDVTDITDETELFTQEKYCSFLYSGNYQLGTIKPLVHGVYEGRVQAGTLNGEDLKFEILYPVAIDNSYDHEGNFTRIRITFPKSLEGGTRYGLIFKYKIQQFARCECREYEDVWFLDVRLYDPKSFAGVQFLSAGDEPVPIQLAYIWVVLPAKAQINFINPQQNLGSIRDLETGAWKSYMPLEVSIGNAIQLRWREEPKGEKPALEDWKNEKRYHINYVIPTEKIILRREYLYALLIGQSIMTLFFTGMGIYSSLSGAQFIPIVIIFFIFALTCLLTAITLYRMRHKFSRLI